MNILASFVQTLNNRAETVTLKTPSNTASHFQLGLAYKEAGKLNNALDSFKKALHLEPENERVKREFELLKSEK